VVQTIILSSLTSSSLPFISSSLSLRPYLEFFLDIKRNVLHLVLLTINCEYGDFLMLMGVIFC
jgi:hypothetical protein